MSMQGWQETRTQAAVPAAQASLESRVGFIRKVYAMFFSGVVVFALAAGVPLLGYMMEVPVLAQFAVALATLPWWAHIIGIVILCVVASKTRGVSGLNVLMFYLLAGGFGFLTVGLIFYAVAVGGPMILLQAIGLTTFTMGGLTAFVFITKKDFDFMGGFLRVGLFLLLGGIVLMLVMHLMGVNVSLFNYALSLVSTLLFCGYVLYHTSAILHRYPTTMVVAAATDLLIDFIILFRNILYLLSARR